MEGSEYKKVFKELANRNLQRISGAEDNTVQQEIANTMSQFITNVVTGKIAQFEYQQFSRDFHVIRYYAPDINNPSEDFIEIMLDDSVTSSITCPVKDLYGNPFFEQFVMEHVSYSYIGQYKKRISSACGFTEEAYKYEFLSYPTDVLKMVRSNLVGEYPGCTLLLNEIDLNIVELIHLHEHFKEYLPISTAMIFGLCNYLYTHDSMGHKVNTLTPEMLSKLREAVHDSTL